MTRCAGQCTVARYPTERPSSFAVGSDGIIATGQVDADDGTARRRLSGVVLHLCAVARGFIRRIDWTEERGLERLLRLAIAEQHALADVTARAGGGTTSDGSATRSRAAITNSPVQSLDAVHSAESR